MCGDICAGHILKKKWVIISHADSKGPDQTAHLRSLIKAFAVSIQNKLDMLRRIISLNKEGPGQTV